MPSVLTSTWRCVLCASFLLFATSVKASDYITDYIPAAEKIGEARLSVMFWDVYDIALYAADRSLKDKAPIALQLRYLRSISGEKIADRTMVEMRKLGVQDEVKLAAWHRQLRQIFPDVEEGTVLAGILTTSGETIFYHDDAKIGVVKDPAFGQAFFDIWLSKNTSSPEVRQALLGGS